MRRSTAPVSSAAAAEIAYRRSRLKARVVLSIAILAAFALAIGIAYVAPILGRCEYADVSQQLRGKAYACPDPPGANAPPPES